MKNVTAGTIARTILVMLALINQFLSFKGLSPIPVNDAELSEFISFIFTAVTALIAWWKNNSFTREAIAADATFK